MKKFGPRLVFTFTSKQTKERRRVEASLNGALNGAEKRHQQLLLQKSNQVLIFTIMTSDTELIERTYIVTPTVTGGPARKAGKAERMIKRMIKGS